MSQERAQVFTGDGVMAYHLLAQRAALKLEIKGLGHSSGRSMAKHLKEKYCFTGNKKQVLAQFEKELVEWGILSPERVTP